MYQPQKPLVHGCFLLMLWLGTNCGSSIFSGIESGDPAVSATVALEQKRPQDAIDILTEALKSDPTNYTLISLLGTAQAQLIGVDFLTIVLKMASSESEESEDGAEAESTDEESEDAGESNDITFLFAALPDANTENINGLDTAIGTLESIPSTERLASDEYKLTIFYTARLALRTKKFDTDGDGLVSPAEMLDLSDDDAAVILESLLDAGDALEAAGASGASAEQIASIQAAIDASEGETQADKLRNYLGGSSNSSSATTTLK